MKISELLESKIFPNTKVVDKFGKPLVVYHGTDKKFTEFKSGYGTVATLFSSEYVKRHGFFFAVDKNLASEYSTTGNIIAAYLNIKNYFDLIDLKDDQFDRIQNVGFNIRYFSSRPPGEYWEVFDGDDGEFFVECLEKAGFDGVRMIEPDNDRVYRTIWVALYSNQIKIVNMDNK